MLRSYTRLLAGRGILPLFVTTMLVMAGNSLVTPILSIYGSIFSASSTMIGMVITIFGIGRFIANIPSGLLGQYFGLRFFICSGPAIVSIGSLLAVFANDLPTLLACRFVQGVGSGIFMTSAATALAELASAGDRGRIMALHQASMIAGASLGPAIGGVLASNFGFTAPFWAYAVVCGFAAVSGFQVPNKQMPRHQAAETDASAQNSTWRALLTLSFLSICLINFAIFLTRAAAQLQVIPLLGHNVHHLDLDILGSAMGTIAICNFAAIPATGVLIDRFGARMISIAATILLALSLLLIAISTHLTVFLIGLMLYGAASGINGAAISTYAAEAAPSHRYGPAMGILRSFGDAGFLIGPVLIGGFQDIFGLGLASALYINVALVAAVVVVAILSTRHGKTSPPLPARN